jgi:hypothetical protein
MDNEIQLISDGDGLAVIGNATDVEHFLTSEGLASKDLGLNRLKSIATTGAVAAQAGSYIAENSARWVKLTAESARRIDRHGLRKSSKTGLSTGVLSGPKGQIAGFVEFAKNPRTLSINPTTLANAAGIMAQLAMQQSIEEITDYLAAIDAKVDDVLRAQKDAVLSRMIGVAFVIEEALTLRAVKGKVDDVTWSKVQGVPATIAETQAYALRQLDAIAEKLELKTDISELAAIAKEAETTAREWLAVLARSFQLQDAIAVLELDRVLDASPDELDGHRLGLKAARQDRLELIARCTERLLVRMNAVADTANAKVLLHPTKSPTAVQSSNRIASGVHDFNVRLGIESGHQSSDARRWMDAATEAKDKALDTGSKGVDAAKSLGNETLSRANSIKGRLSGGIADLARLRHDKDKEGKEEG